MGTKYSFFLVLLISWFTHGQIQTTGLIALDGTMSFQLDKDLTNSIVTLTINGPADRWFSIGFNAELMLANTDCVVMTSNNQLTDAYLPGGHYAPIADLENDWNLQLDTVNNITGIRSIVATRSISTGHIHDYDFAATSGVLHTIWAYSSTPEYVLSHHGSDNYGGADITFTTLGTSHFEKYNLKVYPNPADQQFTISIPDTLDILNLQIVNELGQIVFAHCYKGKIQEQTIDCEDFEDEVYFIKAISEQSESISRLIIKH